MLSFCKAVQSKVKEQWDNVLQTFGTASVAALLQRYDHALQKCNKAPQNVLTLKPKHRYYQV